MSALVTAFDAVPVALWSVLGVLFVLVALRVARALSGPSTPPVVARPLMTRAELRCLDRLERAAPQARVFAQVSMGALLAPRPGLSRSDFWRVRGRFGQKIVDFVLYDTVAECVLAVVELDDWSHERRRDSARDAMLIRGGYPVIRIGPNPTVAQLRTALGPMSAAVSCPASAPVVSLAAKRL